MQKIIFLILISMGATAHAASFNCNKASTPLEKTICNNQPLSNADGELGRLYGAIRKNLKEDGKKLFKSEHRRWLKSRAQTCPSNDNACLLKLYTKRNEHLSFQNSLYSKQRMQLAQDSNACDYRLSRPIQLVKGKGGFIASAEYTKGNCIDASLNLTIINAHKNEVVFQEAVSVKTLTMYEGDFNAKEQKAWAKRAVAEKLSELVNIREWPVFRFSSVEEKYSQSKLWQETHDRTDLSHEDKWQKLYALEECGFEYSISKKSYQRYSQQDFPLFGYGFGENGAYYAYIPRLEKVIKVGGGCY